MSFFASDFSKRLSKLTGHRPDRPHPGEQTRPVPERPAVRHDRGMNVQLDILALEPFHGGPRKAMLDALLRYSRHRWTVLKLPPRRIERRLVAAAHWFAEQISRHWAGRLDVLMTSEAMNLGDLFRLVPQLADKPSVVYFHDNQLPSTYSTTEAPHQVVNLGTAAAATEIWFNSLYHLRTFLKRATVVVERHPELAGRNPLPAIAAKAQLMPPPVDLSLGRQLLEASAVERDPRMLFVDTRDADIRTLNAALGGLYRRGEKYTLTTVGPVDGLDESLPRSTISERDDDAQIRAMLRSAVMFSARPGAASDHYAVRALQLGCWPIFPNSGVYPELLPKSLHSQCLYDSIDPTKVVNQLQNVWWMERPKDFRSELSHLLGVFDAATAVANMDDRLEQLAIAASIRGEIGSS